MTLLAVEELAASNTYDLVVLDCAPTDAALRLVTLQLGARVDLERVQVRSQLQRRRAQAAIENVAEAVGRVRGDDEGPAAALGCAYRGGRGDGRLANSAFASVENEPQDPTVSRRRGDLAVIATTQPNRPHSRRQGHCSLRPAVLAAGALGEQNRAAVDHLVGANLAEAAHQAACERSIDSSQEGLHSASPLLASGRKGRWNGWEGSPSAPTFP
jgi:hypothetical protein